MGVKDDQIMAQVLSTLGRLEARVGEVGEDVKDSHRALRGYDAEPGLVAQTRELTSKIEDLHNSSRENKSNISDLQKRMRELEEYLEEYPTLSWLLHHKTKTFVAWCLAGFGLLILILSPWLDRSITLGMLRLIHIPDPIIKFYFPGLIDAV